MMTISQILGVSLLLTLGFSFISLSEKWHCHQQWQKSEFKAFTQMLINPKDSTITVDSCHQSLLRRQGNAFQFKTKGEVIILRPMDKNTSWD